MSRRRSVTSASSAPRVRPRGRAGGSGWIAGEPADGARQVRAVERLAAVALEVGGQPLRAPRRHPAASARRPAPARPAAARSRPGAQQRRGRVRRQRDRVCARHPPRWRRAARRAGGRRPGRASRRQRSTSARRGGVRACSSTIRANARSDVATGASAGGPPVCTASQALGEVVEQDAPRDAVDREVVGGQQQPPGLTGAGVEPDRLEHPPGVEPQPSRSPASDWAAIVARSASGACPARRRAVSRSAALTVPAAPHLQRPQHPGDPPQAQAQRVVVVEQSLEHGGELLRVRGRPGPGRAGRG